MGEGLAIAMFAVTCGFLLLGFPVAFTLAGSAFLFGGLGVAFGVFDFAFFGAYAQQIFGRMTNPVLVAVPLFVFMGVMLERSRVAEDLLGTMGNMLGRVRGGLGISVTLVGALLAASTGIIGATVVTMGVLSLPIMLRRGYDPGLACGGICAAATLGQIIPPSIVLVLLGEVMATSYQQAQLSLGNFSPDTVSVGDLFAGALLPGLVLVAFYLGYQYLIALVRPDLVPPLASTADAGAARRDSGHICRVLLPPVVLIVVVLGSILAGVATPTEAAAVGAVGASLLAARRLDHEAWPKVLAAVLALAGLVALAVSFDLRLGRLSPSFADQAGIAAAAVLCAVAAWGVFMALRSLQRQAVLKEVSEGTLRITAMVFTILIGAALFSLVFRGLGGADLVHDFLADLPGGVVGAMLFVMAVMFVLGFFLDFIEIVYVVVPIVAPPLLVMGLDPVWLGVMIAVNLQTSFLTPPFGFALFYLRGVAPPEVRTVDIYRGVMPFIGIQLLALAVLALFPELVTWLPKAIYGP